MDSWSKNNCQCSAIPGLFRKSINKYRSFSLVIYDLNNCKYLLHLELLIGNYRKFLKFMYCLNIEILSYKLPKSYVPKVGGNCGEIWNNG